MFKAHLNKRNATADLLIGLAVLLMIQVHIMELFAFPWVSRGSPAKSRSFLAVHLWRLYFWP